MISLFRKLFISLVALQLTATSLSAETTSHIAYASAWTGNGIAQDLNKALHLAQKQAFNENKSFKLLEVSIAPEWGYAYILYNLSDDTHDADAFISKIAYASGWTGGTLATSMQDKINSLQDKAYKEGRKLNILDIKVTPEWGFAYIVYEIEQDQLSNN